MGTSWEPEIQFGRLCELIVQQQPKVCPSGPGARDRRNALAAAGR